MKRSLMTLALLSLTGCSCSDQPDSTMGTYTSATATVVRKYDLTGDHYHARCADLRIGGKVVPCKIPGRLDEVWWANLVERETYRVTLEEKAEGRYVWHYETIPR